MITCYLDDWVVSFHSGDHDETSTKDNVSMDVHLLPEELVTVMLEHLVEAAESFGLEVTLSDSMVVADKYDFVLESLMRYLLVTNVH